MSRVFGEPVELLCCTPVICLQNMALKQIHLFFTPWSISVSPRRPMWLINQQTTFLLFYRPFDLWWMFHFRCRLSAWSPLDLSAAQMVEKFRFGERRRRHTARCFTRPSMAVKHPDWAWIWIWPSFFFFFFVTNVNLFSYSLVGGGGGGDGGGWQETVSGLFPRRWGGNNRFTQGWSFQA